MNIPSWCFGPRGLSYLWATYRPREIIQGQNEAFKTAPFRQLYEATGNRRSRS